jgi:hypothetical protein
MSDTADIKNDVDSHLISPDDIEKLNLKNALHEI